MSESSEFQAAKEAAREAGRVSALLESIDDQLKQLTMSHKESSAEYNKRIAALESLKERFEETRVEQRLLGREFDTFRIKDASEKTSISTQVKIYAGLAGAVGMAIGSLLMNYFATHLK